MARVPSTRRIAAAAARQTFSQLLSEVRREEEPVIIEKGGVPIAAVVPLSMLERERRWDGERAQRVALLRRLRRPFEDISPGEVEREAIAAVTAVRSERRRKQKTAR